MQRVKPAKSTAPEATTQVQPSYKSEEIRTVGIAEDVSSCSHRPSTTFEGTIPEPAAAPRTCADEVDPQPGRGLQLLDPTGSKSMAKVEA